MSVNITEWIPDVFIEIGDNQCPPSKIKKAIILSLREFCKKTLLWQKDLDSISITDNSQEYSLSSTDGDIISICNVLYKQDSLANDQFTRLTPTSKKYEDENSSGNWRYQTSVSPNRFYIENDKKINLVPIPTEASTDGLLVSVFLQPFITATAVENFLYVDHQELITLGAVSKLLSEEGTLWTNVEAGFRKKALFSSQCDDVSGIKTTGYTNRPLRVRFNRMV